MGAGDVVVVDVGDVVGLRRVGPHRPDDGAPRLVAVHVGDEDVATVALHADAVVTAGHGPVLEEDVVGVPLIWGGDVSIPEFTRDTFPEPTHRVYPVSVHGIPLAVTCCVHV